MSTKLKYTIAKMIESGYKPGEFNTYEDLIESINDNYYRTIAKVPIDMFILGIIGSFSNLTVDKANTILTSLKEVVQDALETTGIELTFTDSDWHNLKITENPSKWGGKYLLTVNETKLEKSYMSELFEV